MHVGKMARVSYGATTNRLLREFKELPINSSAVPKSSPGDIPSQWHISSYYTTKRTLEVCQSVPYNDTQEGNIGA